MRVLIFLFALLIFFPLGAKAETLQMAGFARIPIQHEGRIKPLDTFARTTLQVLSGKDALGGSSAIAWLARTMFDPVEAAQDRIFLIEDATLRHRLGLRDLAKPLYSYADIAPGLGRTFKDIELLASKAPEDLSREERALLHIHEKALLYTQILRSFSLILPLSLEVPEQWQKKTKGATTYLELRKFERDIEQDASQIVTKKGEDPSLYSEDERKTALLAYQLRLLGDTASRNQLLRLIPVEWSEAKGEWQSPWSILQGGYGSPQTGEILAIWRQLAQAWQAGNGPLWASASSSAVTTPLEITKQDDLIWRLDLEVMSNTLQPFTISTGLYITALLCGLAFFVTGRGYWRSACFLACCAGLIVQSCGIGVRVFLLERPPVSTLYESLIFVGLVSVAIGMLLERRLRNGLGVVVAAAAGSLIGILAAIFAGDGDTLRLLSAVLDTRFWLATHVLCITIGYGWCVIAALLAHCALIQIVIGKGLSPSLLRTVWLSSLVALLFTAVGTILGGIWADQSWGRFWGWDPKENGALLIVLWLVWLLHGKLSGHLSPLALLAGHAFLSVIVGMAWLGVNLLGVGLHSYGFTEGLFHGLGLFTFAELMLIAALWHKAKCREQYEA